MPLARVDDAVRRILRVKLEAGLFERPFTDPALLADVGSADHRALARRAVAAVARAAEERGRHAAARRRRIARSSSPARAPTTSGCRAAAGRSRARAWPGAITPGTTILDGIRASVADPAQVVYDADGTFGGRGDGREPVADVAVVVLAETPYAEGVGDRADLAPAGRPTSSCWPGSGRAPTASSSCCCPGRPLVVTDQLADWDAFVAAWLPGSEGAGVADVLFGRAPVHRPAAVHVAALERAGPVRPGRAGRRPDATARCSRAATPRPATNR